MGEPAVLSLPDELHPELLDVSGVGGHGRISLGKFRPYTTKTVRVAGCRLCVQFTPFFGKIHPHGPELGYGVSNIVQDRVGILSDITGQIKTLESA